MILTYRHIMLLTSVFRYGHILPCFDHHRTNRFGFSIKQSEMEIPSGPGFIRPAVGHIRNQETSSIVKVQTVSVTQSQISIFN